jgi:hypothetical protein
VPFSPLILSLGREFSMALISGRKLVRCVCVSSAD